MASSSGTIDGVGGGAPRALRAAAFGAVLLLAAACSSGGAGNSAGSSAGNGDGVGGSHDTSEAGATTAGAGTGVTTTSTRPARSAPPIIGAALAFPALTADRQYARVAAARFDMVTPENEMKWAIVHPAPGVYDFDRADAIVDRAEAAGQRVHGHNLVWHAFNPDWLTSGTFTEGELRRTLRGHIRTVAGHFRGSVELWDVVNEALDESGELRESLWSEGIGPEFVDLAFRWAHEADPGALLFYNEYGAEGLGAKSDGVYRLVKGMIARGVPIDGVGLQMHTTIDPAPGPNAPLGAALYRPDPSDLVVNMRRLADLGLEVAVTELDVRGPAPATAEALAAQAEVYGDVMSACIAVPACTSVTAWGFTDRYSWVPSHFPGVGDALPFDARLRPKPAYDAMCAQLAGYETRFCT